MLELDEAIRRLRSDPTCDGLVRDAYLGRDVRESAARFAASDEFGAVLTLLGDTVANATVVDLGAGTGIASAAFAGAGAALVYAVEPDASDEVGRGAIERLAPPESVVPVDAVGEDIPVADATVDIVYTRQVLHHASDLHRLVVECARVLRPGGLLLATREHVVDDARELQRFLDQHPVHRLAGGEHAFTLDQYLAAIRTAGLSVDTVLGPWDSIVNAFPLVRTTGALEGYARDLLMRRFGAVGALGAAIPAVEKLVWTRVRRRVTPGRMYSFLARKPG
jgi:SAM-dependent methyltransferase